MEQPLDILARLSFGRVADAIRYEGNAVFLQRDGTEAFPVWLDAIAKAERSVLFENYIIRDDAVGRSFAEALSAAAARGVRCRLLYDWLGCVQRTPGRFWRRLAAAGVEVRSYNPPRIGNPLILGNRDHRKLLCVDGAVAFTGGLCVGREWVGRPERNIPPWRDTAIEIRGPGAGGLAATFADSWRAAGGQFGEEEFPPEETGPGGDVGVWVVPGRPEGMGLYRLEQLVADLVQRSLWLADAYFVATTGYVRALTGAAQAGADVRLLVPGATDNLVVRALSRAAYRPLLEAGVRIFEWNGPMMHAKTAVADGCWSRIGSSNSNLASWATNRELDVVIQDTGLAAQMEAMYETDLGESTEIVLRSGRVRPSEGHARPSRRSASSRLLAGAVGLGSAVGATLSRHRTLDASEARVIGLAGGLLLLVAALGLTMPGLLAYPLGAAAAWVAGVLLTRAWRLYRDHLVGDDPP